MRAIIQRVTSASVRVEGETLGKVEGMGLLIFLGVGSNDAKEDADWLIRKILSMRIFPDDEGKMNKSCKDVNGQLLIISQFTLWASTKKGNRPSFIRAATPDHAEKLYTYFIEECVEEIGVDMVSSGRFGADMKISLLNDGPVTIWLDTENKE